MQLQFKKKDEWRNVVRFTSKKLTLIRKIVHTVYLEPERKSFRILDDAGRFIPMIESMKGR